MNIWFTSDTHFGHENIIKYCNRPYPNVRIMDDEIIHNWNSRIQPTDTVYHLGDFCFNNFNRYFHSLNGQIHFIEGNHDKEAFANRNKFASYNKFKEIRINGQKIVLCHYALRVWNKSHHGSWHIYGHSHGTLPDEPNALSFDVGVDCHNYFPISFEEVATIMKKKTWTPIDHHGLSAESGGGNGHSAEEYAKLVRESQYKALKKEFDT